MDVAHYVLDMSSRPDFSEDTVSFVARSEAKQIVNLPVRRAPSLHLREIALQGLAMGLLRFRFISAILAA